jgi:hypothetical protein
VIKEPKPVDLGKTLSWSRTTVTKGQVDCWIATAPAGAAPVGLRVVVGLVVIIWMSLPSTLAVAMPLTTEPAGPWTLSEKRIFVPSGTTPRRTR